MMLSSKAFKYIEQYLKIITELKRRLGDPQKRIEDFKLRIDDFSIRMVRSFKHQVDRKHERLVWRNEKLYAVSPLAQTDRINDKLEKLSHNILNNINISISNKSFLLRELNAKLHALNPDAILQRGYSITKTLPDGDVVRNPDTVHLGQNLEVRVAKGLLFCKVEGK
jgi:exodeoxyribonuclease VII large subunit